MNDARAESVITNFIREHYELDWDDAAWMAGMLMTDLRQSGITGFIHE